MKLEYVTLTGADESVKPQQLLDLSKKYPYVEWAILFSQSKAGVPRYPSYDWVIELAKLNSADPKPMNLSAHLCGAWVDNAMKGNLGFLNDSLIATAFSRVQLNMGQSRLRSALSCQPLLDAVKAQSDHRFIFGGNYTNAVSDPDVFWKYGFHPLFDASGGRGVEAKEWPKPYDSSSGMRMLHGYAGGLGPDNVVQELERIRLVTDDDGVIWIDMESKLRTKTGKQDVFDLSKCEQVLEACRPFVREKHES